MARGESTIPLKMLLFCFHGANTIIVSFLPLYLQFRGLSGTEIGWVMAIGPLVAIFSQPFWGYTSDKYRTVKKILMLCLIGLIISILSADGDLTVIINIWSYLLFLCCTYWGIGRQLITKKSRPIRGFLWLNQNMGLHRFCSFFFNSRSYLIKHRNSIHRMAVSRISSSCFYRQYTFS